MVALSQTASSLVSLLLSPSLSGIFHCVCHFHLYHLLSVVAFLFFEFPLKKLFQLRIVRTIILPACSVFTSYPGQLRRSGAVHSVDYLPEVLRLRIGNAATLSNSSLLFLSCSPCFFESRFWLVFVTITWKILNLSIVFSVQNSQVPLKKTFDENRDTLSCLWCDYWLLEWSIKKLRGSAPCTVQMERSDFKAANATPLSPCFLSFSSSPSFLDYDFPLSHLHLCIPS